LEALTGFETENQYDIFGIVNGQTQQVLYAAEQSDCCGRQCCGSSRPFGMLLFGANDPAGQPVLSIDRPLRCKPPLGCCCLQELTVYSGGGRSGGDRTPIGTLQQDYVCCGSEFSVLVGGILCFRILGPVCVCDGPCCGDQEFFIVTPTGHQHIPTPGGDARITKLGGGDSVEAAVQEAATDADNFGCTFPPFATPEQKAVLLAAVFLIDFLFFEDSGGPAGSSSFGDD
jgi:hypothetical protein